MSGHSKWSQVKHKKALTDAKRGQAFSKMVREIAIAAKIGGISPDSNTRLRSAMDRARALGLPKDNIERALAKASGGEEGTNLQEFLYEASAPFGVAMLIEGITDNKNRTLSEIRRLLLEYGGKLAESGSLLWNFKKIGVLEIFEADNPQKTADEVALRSIEAGAEDFNQFEDAWVVEVEFLRLTETHRALEEGGIKIKKASHDYKSKSAIELSVDQREKIEKLIDKLAEHDDVQKVYTNLTPNN